MKKLIFFDIDGTVITDDGLQRIIPENTLKALHELRDNGHLCFINTGRSLAELDKLIKGLPFDGYLCGCGTYIEYMGKKLFSHTLPKSLGNQILGQLNACHLEWVLEGTSNIYYSSEPYKTRIGKFKKEHLALLPDTICMVPPKEATNLPFDKFCICLGKDSEFDKFYATFQDSLTFIDRGGGFYEIVPHGFSKASGIAYLESYFHIPHEHTIAIGDSTNDLPMLDYAAYSIAMGNSDKELFPVVDYITDSVLDDGIYHAMQHLKLI